MTTTAITPDVIVLHDLDNVATALRDLAAGVPARVASTHGTLADITPSVPIRLGHKTALRPISNGDLVVKHGYPIGRATADIAAGDHVHVHNVISLSRETDDALTEEGS